MLRSVNCKSGGNTKSTITNIHASEIISNSPMLAVPGWLDNHRAPKPHAVVPALKVTARASGD